MRNKGIFSALKANNAIVAKFKVAQKGAAVGMFHFLTFRRVQ